MNILIVDDNADDRRLLRYSLVKHGCEQIIEARDGQEGLEMAKVHRPDLIISDALMPRMDGFEFLRKVKMDDELKTIPFVFHSAVYTGLKDKELALSLGAEAFIAKPKEPGEFWEELSEVLKGLETGRERPPAAEPLPEEKEYLRKYSGVVAAKLEEKVRELEETLDKRKKAEEALRSSEIRYRRLFEAAKDGILILYADTGKIIDVNPFMVDLLGYPPEEYLGKTLCDAGPFMETKACTTLFRELQSRDYIRYADIPLQAGDGRLIDVEFVICRYTIDDATLIQCNIRDITERKRAEEALRESEIQRYQLQTELACAAQVQAKLLPDSYPNLPNFEFAARCLPAQQVGGDFYDWVEVAPGIIGLTLGDVMGKGMSAAMLMSTARAGVHTATLQNQPAAAVQLAERALRPDLESSESFVTLFHAHLNIYTRTLTYVDCGHGYVFLRRSNGTVEELTPRGLPLGVPTKELYQEGVLTFAEGDALVLYSDGLIDARPDLALTNRLLAGRIEGAASAREMMDLLLALPGLEGPPPDDLTVMVIRCNGDMRQT
ncbi:MAG: SpoIIE family protein phosphatase [Geobacteraceae bacterium]|jgi:PAS domain S-box-containing protein